MTDQIIQLANGVVRVQQGDLVYYDTADNFAADNGSAAPALADGVTERVYEPTRRHAFVADDSVIGGGDMPWPFGDAAIAACSDLIAAKAARAEAPPAPPLTPGTTPPTLVASAFNITVADGDIASMDGVFNLGAGLYLGVGQYMLFFIAPQPDAGYFAVVSGDALCLRVTDRQPEYLMIEARNGVSGDLVDAGMISVQAFRF